ncbi:MAG TPA: hypothetical protein VNT03_12845, partial [Baekduia sp.]|nr:hypothetical protein [Baekduia sp.]
SIRLPRRAALTFAVLLATAGSAFAASTIWSPQLGDDHRGHPQASTIDATPEQRSIIATLRRPQVAADRGDNVQTALRYLSPGEVQGIRLSEVRLLRSSDTGSVILVPVDSAGGNDRAGVQRDALLLLYSTYVGERANQVGDPLAPSLARAGINVVQTHGTLSELKTRTISAVAPAQDGYHLFGLAPDSVAAVDVSVRGQTPIRGDIRNNSFDVNIGDRPASVTIRLLDADGRVIDVQQP